MRCPRFVVCLIITVSAGLWAAALAPVQAAPAISPDHGAISLAEALHRAARQRPELAAVRQDLEAAGLKLGHAALPPNPELGVEWDNLGGNVAEDEGRETTISLSQPFELGGKALARQGRGQAEIERLRREQAAVWLDIGAEVSAAFLAVQAARERLALQREAEQIAVELAAITHERVAAGELAATEETRAAARQAETMAETSKLARLLAEAEQGLALALAEPDSGVVSAAGPLAQEVAIPERQTLLSGLEQSPVLALRKSERQLAASSLALEQANAWSDPALSLAVRERPGVAARAVTVGVSIPLPLFQRNQAALAEAGAGARKAAINEEAAARRLRNELLKAHGVLVAADQEARIWRQEVIRRAAEAAEAVREGFRAGKFRYSDVLEATQTLVTVKARHLDAILDLNRAAIDLDRLQGRPAFPDNGPQPVSFSQPRSQP